MQSDIQGFQRNAAICKWNSSNQYHCPISHH